ncbi:hypothetical protein D3C73_1249970 [compost metagenome]
MAAEHVRQVRTGFTIDGDAKRRQPLAPGLQHRLAGVFNAVAPLVQIQVIGLAVREQQQQLAPPLAAAQQLGGLADGGPHARVVTRLEPLNAPPGSVVITLIERLEFLHPHLLAAQRGKPVQGKVVAQHRQGFAEQQQAVADHIDHPMFSVQVGIGGH